MLDYGISPQVTCSPMSAGEGLKQIADGVWAFLRPPGSWGQTNTGLIVDPGAASMVIDTVWDTRWAKRVASATSEPT
ncbi:glyoxylase-like metal-dependent hydrolase (beta-lactamase superfamily II) [Rhodococcus sp. UYP5]